MYDSFELTVLLQEPRLLLLQSENVLCGLLQDGGLGKRGIELPVCQEGELRPPPQPPLSRLKAATHLAELLSIAVWDERFKCLEAGVDALHTPTLVAVGDLSANPPLLVTRCFWGQRNVGQTKGGRWGCTLGFSRTWEAEQHTSSAVSSFPELEP